MPPGSRFPELSAKHTYVREKVSIRYPSMRSSQCRRNTCPQEVPLSTNSSLEKKPTSLASVSNFWGKKAKIFYLTEKNVFSCCRSTPGPSSPFSLTRPLGMTNFAIEEFGVDPLQFFIHVATRKIYNLVAPYLAQIWKDTSSLLNVQSWLNPETWQQTLLCQRDGGASSTLAHIPECLVGAAVQHFQVIEWGILYHAPCTIF